MSDDDRLRENLTAVRGQIADAAVRSGRSSDSVKLIAVTKYVDVFITEALVRAGCHDLGESRPQQLWQKAEALSTSDVHWHLIGHLQSNKARRTLPLISLLHSIDSLKLLNELDRTAAQLQLRVAGLIEVNISQDATKHGFHPDEVAGVLEACAACEHLEIRGLMGMSSREGDLDVAQREFASLRELRDKLRANAPERVSLDELSMGMSGDFEVAILEGATLVRVGSRLFEGLVE